MRHNKEDMRIPLPFVLAGLLTFGCGGSPRRPTTPAPSPTVPADDIAVIKGTAKPVADPGGPLEAKDPRTIDLDIIQIRAPQVGGEGDSVVATADLFRAANDAAKAGRSQEAIGRYRQLVSQFPESLYAPISLFNIAAIYDGQGDVSSTITTLRELVGSYPKARESIEGHLYIAALQAEKKQWPDALTTLDDALARTNLTFADRVEANARRGYVLLELGRNDDAETAFVAAQAEWRRAPRIDDVYYIAMASYYRGEIRHRKFLAAPLRLPDDQLVGDLEAKRVLATDAYDLWRDSLGHSHPYWATAAGYQMSQIFVELWEATVKAPYPTKLATTARDQYVVEVHERVRVHLKKALEGHRMNVELAKAYGVDTVWSQGSAQRAVQVMELLAKDAPGTFVRP